MRWLKGVVMEMGGICRVDIISDDVKSMITKGVLQHSRAGK